MNKEQKNIYDLFTAIDIKNFQELFEGRKSAFGEFRETEIDDKGKVQGISQTIQAPISEDLYIAHLRGTKGLGIVPINESNMVKFGVIDLDIYTKKIKDTVLKTISIFNIPLCVFTSKSGGLHMYLFFTRYTPAKYAIKTLEKLRVILGLPKETEIFPKQSSIEDGRVGNWINLPYYDTVNNKSKRVLLNDKGEDVENALVAIDYCNKMRQTPESLDRFFLNLPLQDAPPCLQRLYMLGNVTQRNDYLFSLAHYFKVKYGDQFEDKVLEANSKLHEPLQVREVVNTVIASSKKKDYKYACTKEPLLSYCDRAECQLREYGIKSKSISNLSFGEFRQILTDPPYYEWMVDEALLKLDSEDDIINQTSFRKQCIRHLHVMPNRIKEDAWSDIVNRALQNVILVEVDLEEDTSLGAMVTKGILEFIEKRNLGSTLNSISRGMVFEDEESFIFTPIGLINFLIGIKQFKPNNLIDIRSKLEDLGGSQKTIVIGNKPTNCWTLPLSILGKPKEIEEKIDFLEKLGLKDI